ADVAEVEGAGGSLEEAAEDALGADLADLVLGLRRSSFFFLPFLFVRLFLPSTLGRRAGAVGGTFRLTRRARLGDAIDQEAGQLSVVLQLGRLGGEHLEAPAAFADLVLGDAGERKAAGAGEDDEVEARGFGRADVDGAVAIVVLVEATGDELGAG